MLLRLVALRNGADSVCPRRTNCYVRRNAFCALTLPQYLLSHCSASNTRSDFTDSSSTT